LICNYQPDIIAHHQRCTMVVDTLIGLSTALESKKPLPLQRTPDILRQVRSGGLLLGCG